MFLRGTESATLEAAKAALKVAQGIEDKIAKGVEWASLQAANAILASAKAVSSLSLSLPRSIIKLVNVNHAIAARVYFCICVPDLAWLEQALGNRM